MARACAVLLSNKDCCGRTNLKKNLEISVSEITTVRVTCLLGNPGEVCGGVIYIPVRRLKTYDMSLHCPVCGHLLPIESIADIRGLKALGLVLESLGTAQNCRLDFVLPCNDKMAVNSDSADEHSFT